jgi:hypothetical protein
VSTEFWRALYWSHITSDDTLHLSHEPVRGRTMKQRRRESHLWQNVLAANLHPHHSAVTVAYNLNVLSQKAEIYTHTFVFNTEQNIFTSLYGMYTHRVIKRAHYKPRNGQEGGQGGGSSTDLKRWRPLRNNPVLPERD